MTLVDDNGVRINVAAVSASDHKEREYDQWHKDCHKQGCIKQLHGGSHCAAGKCAVRETRL